MAEKTDLERIAHQLTEAYESACKNARDAWKQNEMTLQANDELQALNNALTEENTELTAEITRLSSKIRQLELAEELDETWIPPDDHRRVDEPGWWYLEPYYRIFRNLHFKYPGLITAVDETIKANNRYKSDGIPGVVTSVPTEEETLTELTEKYELIPKPPTTVVHDKSTQTTPPRTRNEMSTQTNCVEPSTSGTSVRANPTARKLSSSQNPVFANSASRDDPARPKKICTHNPFPRYESPHMSFSSSPVAAEYSPSDYETPRNPVPSTSNMISTEYSVYDYEFPKHPVPSHLESAIPSLLDIEVKPPSEVDPNVVNWLRRSARRGCWNCGSRTHRFENCYKPKKYDFCEVCGQEFTTTEDCEICRLNQEVLEPEP